MKIHGEKIEGLNTEEIVIPRGDGQIVFLARALTTAQEEEFLERCPRPKPKVMQLRGGQKREQTEEPAYRDALNDWAKRQVAWLILTSLTATEGLEWETVDLDDPATWLRYETELRDSGFSDAEIARLINGVMAANGLSEARVEQARQRFLASREGASAT